MMAATDVPAKTSVPFVRRSLSWGKRRPESSSRDDSTSILSDEVLAQYNRGRRPRNPFERSEAFKEYMLDRPRTPIKAEHYVASLSRPQAATELGLKKHVVTAAMCL